MNTCVRSTNVENDKLERSSRLRAGRGSPRPGCAKQRPPPTPRRAKLTSAAARNPSVSARQASQDHSPKGKTNIALKGGGVQFLPGTFFSLAPRNASITIRPLEFAKPLVCKHCPRPVSRQQSPKHCQAASQTQRGGGFFFSHNPVPTRRVLRPSPD